MNSLIESLNDASGHFLAFAGALLWQSSLLIALVFAGDWLLRHKIRASVRYALWFAVFLKLVVPPSLALPTSAAWWLRLQPVTVATPHVRTMTVDYRDTGARTFAPTAQPAPMPTPPPPQLSRDAQWFAVSLLVTLFLAAWVIFRWRQIARSLRETSAPDANISALLAEARRQAGIRATVRLRITSAAISPAVCGLFRPVILLPQSLIEKLTASQLRAVLLHELIHLRRRDVWVNCAQTLLQIFYWWHPLLWIANARVRRLREEAVDDAVMSALNEDAEIYAPTLLEVAKHAFYRPLASLGLVGILESRHALRHRIERLLNSSTPRRAGVSLVSLICVGAFTALAVPMGEPPARSAATNELFDTATQVAFRAKVNPQVFIRNLKARAPETMHTPNDDLNAILASIMDGFGVNCSPPHEIRFDPATGEVTTSNSSEALVVVDEVVKELNLAGGERVLNPPHGLKQVLIEANFYKITSADFAKLSLDSAHSHHDPNVSPWWDLPATDYTRMQQTLKSLGVQPFSAPRVLTSHGVAATLFIGDNTNNIELQCIPYVRNGTVNLTALARTTGKYTLDGKGWPDIAGQTNTAIFSRAGIPDGDGILLRAGQPATNPDSEMILLIKTKLVDPTSFVTRTLAPAQPVATPEKRVAATNLTFSSPEREKIYEKIKGITFDKIAFSNSQLGEVIRRLSAQTWSNTPGHEGLIFLINRTRTGGTIVGSTSTGILNEATSQPLPVASTNADAADPGLARIKLGEMTNVRLIDVLDAIVKNADRPIKYSIQDYGIEFSGPEPTNALHTRTFQLETNAFFSHLGPRDFAKAEPGHTRTAAEYQSAILSLFKRAGIDLSAPKSVYYNDRKGQLAVHATDSDLQLLEAQISALNIMVPEVTIKARFVEADEDFMKVLFTNSPGLFARPGADNTLTESQFRPILKTLQKSDRANLLNEGQVTTLSGRQANFQVMEVTAVLNGVNATVTNGETRYSYQTTNMTFGSSLDVVADVDADGYRIHLNLTPRVTEFLGYENPGGVPKLDKDSKKSQIPLPKVRVRELTTTATVRDAETVVLIFFSNETVTTLPNGTTVHKPFADPKKKQLIVFVTPTIIDRAGNRVHSADHVDDIQIR